MRRLAKRSRDTRQARALLALAGVYDGMSRARAAEIAGMDRQTFRDRAHRFNAESPDGRATAIAWSGNGGSAPRNCASSPTSAATSRRKPTPRSA